MFIEMPHAWAEWAATAAAGSKGIAGTLLVRPQEAPQGALDVPRGAAKAVEAALRKEHQQHSRLQRGWGRAPSRRWPSGARRRTARYYDQARLPQGLQHGALGAQGPHGPAAAQAAPDAPAMRWARVRSSRHMPHSAHDAHALGGHGRACLVRCSVRAWPEVGLATLQQPPRDSTSHRPRGALLCMGHGSTRGLPRYTTYWVLVGGTQRGQQSRPSAACGSAARQLGRLLLRDAWGEAGNRGGPQAEACRTHVQAPRQQGRAAALAGAGAPSRHARSQQHGPPRARRAHSARCRRPAGFRGPAPPPRAALGTRPAAPPAPCVPRAGAHQRQQVRGSWRRSVRAHGRSSRRHTAAGISRAAPPAAAERQALAPLVRLRGRAPKGGHHHAPIADVAVGVRCGQALPRQARLGAGGRLQRAGSSGAGGGIEGVGVNGCWPGAGQAAAPRPSRSCRWHAWLPV